MARSSDGFDPDDWGDDYTETNAWNMAVSVPHDGAGLAGLHGSRDQLGAKLETIFSRPETGRHEGAYRRSMHEITEARDVRMGMFGHSNQPAHHCRSSGCTPDVRTVRRRPSARSCAGSTRAARSVRVTAATRTTARCRPGTCSRRSGSTRPPSAARVYALSSPLYGHVRVRRDDGVGWEVSAPGNTHEAVYVAGVDVDGVAWTRPWIGHRELVGAGELRFHLADTPQPWGSTEAPPSLTPEIDGEVTPPRLLRDVASTAQLSSVLTVSTTAH